MERRGKKKWKSNNNPTASSAPPWIELPRDVTANILRRLGPEEIMCNAQMVCTTWRSVSAEPSLWRVIELKYLDGLYINQYADSLCRRAVDRSQGELININIKDFGTDDLLRYISERSTHLKILTLDSCECISPRGLTAAVQNLSCLEELHIFFYPVISDQDIETIGASCPMLNSFTFNNRVPEFELKDIDNSHALSIAKNMPNLQSLRLVGNLLSNEGLLAILDGCPNLELLDLLQCFSVELQCDLGRRCSEQVKMLRGPLDFSSDCKWDDRVYYPNDEDEDGSDNHSDYGDVFFSGRYSDPVVVLESVRPWLRCNKDVEEVLLCLFTTDHLLPANSCLWFALHHS